MKGKTFALCLCLLLLFLSSCDRQAHPSSMGKASFQDDEKRTVWVEESPKKVAVLFSSLADMWLIAGGEVSVTVGESVTRGLVPEGVPLVDDGAGKQISHEALVAEAPDLVIGSADVPAHKALVPILEKAGIPIALFRVDTFEDYARVMGIMCELTDREDLYEANVTAVWERIDALLGEADKQLATPRVLFVRVGSGYSATKAKRTEEHFVCAMLSELGAQNLADAAPVLSDGLNIEAILEMNPDYIFFSTMGKEKEAKDYMNGLLETAPWQALTAVQKENYTYLSKELFQYKPCDEWDDAYSILYGHLYDTESKEK